MVKYIISLDNPIRSEGCSELCETLYKKELMLTHLDLSGKHILYSTGCYLMNESIPYIIKILINNVNSKIKYLSLADNFFTEIEILKIFQEIQKETLFYLETLDLSCICLC